MESWKRFLPPSKDYDIPALTPTDLATILKEEFKQPFSAQKVNNLLAKAGLQFKPLKEWFLTEDGKKYANIISFENQTTGHAGYQVKWKVTILDVLRKLIKES